MLGMVLSDAIVVPRKLGEDLKIEECACPNRLYPPDEMSL